MADANDYQFPELKTTFPSEYVAHVELNRPKKYNAFNPA
jgi:delta(3,5)-delta(2,4)-dienoyl-CoA isomerase